MWFARSMHKKTPKKQTHWKSMINISVNEKMKTKWSIQQINLLPTFRGLYGLRVIVDLSSLVVGRELLSWPSDIWVIGRNNSIFSLESVAFWLFWLVVLIVEVEFDAKVFVCCAWTSGWDSEVPVKIVRNITNVHKQTKMPREMGAITQYKFPKLVYFIYL